MGGKGDCKPGVQVRQRMGQELNQRTGRQGWSGGKPDGRRGVGQGVSAAARPEGAEALCVHTDTVDSVLTSHMERRTWNIKQKSFASCKTRKQTGRASGQAAVGTCPGLEPEEEAEEPAEEKTNPKPLGPGEAPSLSSETAAAVQHG